MTFCAKGVFFFPFIGLTSLTRWKKILDLYRKNRRESSVCDWKHWFGHELFKKFRCRLLRTVCFSLSGQQSWKIVYYTYDVRCHSARRLGKTQSNFVQRKKKYTSTRKVYNPCSSCRTSSDTGVLI